MFVAMPFPSPVRVTPSRSESYVSGTTEAGVSLPSGVWAHRVPVPAGFGVWLFRREIARELRAAIELLLG